MNRQSLNTTFAKAFGAIVLALIAQFAILANNEISGIWAEVDGSRNVLTVQTAIFVRSDSRRSVSIVTD